MDPTLPFPSACEAPRQDGESDALRPLDWNTLMARLGAERDLRRELANGLAAVQPVADFACGAALITGGSPHNAYHDARGINPDALINRKATAGIAAAARTTAPVATYDARGQQ